VRCCRRSSGLAEVKFKLAKRPNVCGFAELKSHALAHSFGECFGDAAPVGEGTIALGRIAGASSQFDDAMQCSD
jgi:hypothetical protein